MDSGQNKQKPVAVDLFAGGGGLTLGLKKAGFLVSGAVEYDETACATYFENHKGVVLFRKDIRDISGEEIINTSPTGKIDLIAACPPCQGFSSLTSKYRREDPRNELIFEFVRLVGEIRPATLMMENVPGLAARGVDIFTKAKNMLEKFGYKLAYSVVNVADYGVPQSRRRLVMLGSLVDEIKIPASTHGNSPGMNQYKTVRDVIEGFPEPVTLTYANTSQGPEYFGWHVVRDLSPKNRQRLEALSNGQDRKFLPIELRPDCHKSSDKGFSNVYGRMNWDAPAPTITGGCVTLSKGRFGHPQANRTISVREAAMLQTFPLTYKFRSSYIDKVCTIIGNALPPDFAAAMAKACFNKIIGSNKGD
ncbi:DNA cytosine methyltransferase [Delftia sp. PS-11]|uniref:DNA cytosine methyltransferase n=1 Tax=Delftia sp. PS-11 TaxID=2767222 RepID=UPI0024574F8F|nr:DNA cytosine methyltransferase [Delftia sp. PS-11]KAJ8744612.1 DNA cytosine methyltransferase [Delftia sp. PS-11]